MLSLSGEFSPITLYLPVNKYFSEMQFVAVTLITTDVKRFSECLYCFTFEETYVTTGILKSVTSFFDIPHSIYGNELFL